MERDLELIYFGDPMCSWCWGFSPVLQRLEQRLAIPLRTVVGGLRPTRVAKPVDDAMAKMLAEHWHHVQEASGQPFDFTLLDRRGWIYDTEVACRAVVAVRQESPEHARPFLDQLHRAFYVDGWDLADPDVYAELAAPYYDSPNELPDRLCSDQDLAAETTRDFEQAIGLGIGGFPTVLLRRGEQLNVLTQGYRPYDTIGPALEAWLGAGHSREGGNPVL